MPRSRDTGQRLEAIILRDVHVHVGESAVALLAQMDPTAARELGGSRRLDIHRSLNAAGQKCVWRRPLNLLLHLRLR